MIQLVLDPSETRAERAAQPRPARKLGLRAVLVGAVGLGAVGGVCVAATTLMAGLAAPAPVKLASTSRAADWPELKDGLPDIARTVPPAAAAANPIGLDAQTAHGPSLPEPITAVPTPEKVTVPSPATTLAAASETPAKRIPVAVAVTPIGPARQVAPLPPTRTTALQPPRASETVRARDSAQTSALPAIKPAVAVKAPAPPVTKPAAVAKATAMPAEKGAPKVVAARKVPAAKTAETGKVAAAATVAQAEAPDSDETEVLGIKLPSLAPAGRKLRESVDAFGEAVKKVF